MRWRIGQIVGTTEFTVFLLVLGLGLVLSLTSPQFLTANNLSNLLLQISGIAVASIGMTLIIVSAGIDVSISSMLGMCAVVMGKLAVAGYDPLIVAIAGVATGAVLGCINASLIVFGRIPPIIATLGMLNVLQTMIFKLLGGRWIAGIPMDVRRFALTKWLGVPAPIWVALVLAIIASCVLANRPEGRRLYAVGGNPEAAVLAGINVRKYLFGVYAITGALVGFSGFIYVGKVGIVQTNTGAGFNLDVIAAVVLGGTSILGGRGTVIGSLLGALLVGVIKNGLVLLNIPALWEGVIIGSLILVAVVIDIAKSRRKVALAS